MKNTQSVQKSSNSMAHFGVNLEPVAEETETRDERVTRLYSADGGPLIGWLLEEADGRGQTLQEMSQALGVTYGYFNQLRSGIRKTEHISRDFAVRCANYLGIPTVLVMVLSGHICMRDFVASVEPEHLIVERAFKSMLSDPVARAAMPTCVDGLSIEAQKALVMLYANGLGHDVFGLRALPDMLRWLERAALIHDESVLAVHRGHRDVHDRN